MSTGDLNGNLQRLLRELKAIKYPGDVDEVGLRLGDPVAFLPLLNFSLLKFSRHVARFIVRNGFELAGKTDHRFIESSFRLFRDVLNVRTVLTPSQFFEQGFAERKVLLLCDVIAVCKKLHNEEVRLERLAALKASRQDQSTNRLAAPRRTSPLVKIVRNEGVEIHQVLAPQHLPNATDGAQSVYKTKKTVAFSPSPSPSSRAAGKPIPRPRSSPDVQLTSQKGTNLELTFRPVAPVDGSNAVPPQQAPANRAAASQAALPIHTWFLNPAFDGSEEGGVDLGLGMAFGQSNTGRPDSSAWWRPTSSPQEDQDTSSWQGVSPAAAAGTTSRTVQPASADVDTSGHLFVGGQGAFPRGTSAWQTSSRLEGQQAVAPQQEEQQQRQANSRPSQQQRAGGPHHAGDTATQVSGFAFGSGRHAGRDLDEWSFSKYFGPGKFQQRNNAYENTHMREARPSGQTGGSNGAGGDMEALSGGAQGPSLAGTTALKHMGPDNDDLDRDGPGVDQDRRYGISLAGYAPPALSSAGAGNNMQALAQQQLQNADAPRPSSGALESYDGSARMAPEAEWQAKLVRLELETQEQLQQLRDKLAAAEVELEKTRQESRQSRDVLQARVTVLEGRVRFLECELEVCVKRQPGQEPLSTASPARSSPAAAALPGREPSLGLWQPTGRPRSAGSVLQAAPISSRSAAGSQQQPTSELHQHEDRAAAFQASQAASRAVASYGQQGHSLFPGPARDQYPGHAYLASGSTVAPAREQAAPIVAAQLRASVGVEAAGSTVTAAPAASSEAGPAFRGSTLGQPGGTGSRLPRSFSPMPQPSFSFQPSSLMQQVASATAGSLGHVPRMAQPELAAGLGSLPTGRHAAQVHGGSLDSAPASSQNATDTVASGDGQAPYGARSLGIEPTRTSFDSGLRPPGSFSSADGPAGTVPGIGVTGASHAAAWKAPERPGVRLAGPGSILDGITAVRTMAPQEQHHTALPAAAIAVGGVGVTAVAQLSTALANQPDGPGALQNSSSMAPWPSTATYGAAAAQAAHQLVPGSTGAAAADGGSIGAGPGSSNTGSGFRNTDDLINSLYMRYTEAQDFLHTLRKR